MLKCSRCGDYYIPGYLDCRCRTMSHSSSQFDLVPSAQPSNDAFAMARPAGEAKSAPVTIQSPGNSTPSTLSAGRSGLQQGPQ